MMKYFQVTSQCPLHDFPNAGRNGDGDGLYDYYECSEPTADRTRIPVLPSNKELECGSTIASEILHSSRICRHGCPWSYHRHPKRSPRGARTAHHPDSGSSETLSRWVETPVDTNANIFKYSNLCVISTLYSPY